MGDFLYLDELNVDHLKTNPIEDYVHNQKPTLSLRTQCEERQSGHSVSVVRSNPISGCRDSSASRGYFSPPEVESPESCTTPTLARESLQTANPGGSPPLKRKRSASI